MRKVSSHRNWFVEAKVFISNHSHERIQSSSWVHTAASKMDSAPFCTSPWAGVLTRSLHTPLGSLAAHCLGRVCCWLVGVATACFHTKALRANSKNLRPGTDLPCRPCLRGLAEQKVPSAHHMNLWRCRPQSTWYPRYHTSCPSSRTRRTYSLIWHTSRSSCPAKCFGASG